MNPENEISLLDLEYKKLEVQRLKIELQEMRKSWYLKPAFLSIFIPIIAGIITAAIGYVGNEELKRYKQEKKSLISEISEITTDMESLRTNLLSSASMFLELFEPFYAKGDDDAAYIIKKLLTNRNEYKKFMKLMIGYYKASSNTAMYAIELKIKYSGEDKEDQEMLNRLRSFQSSIERMYQESLKDFDAQSK